MPIFVTKGARKVLAKLKPNPPPLPTPEALRALWALPGRPGETLLLLSRKNGKRYQVLKYRPAKGEVDLLNVDGGNRFTAKVTPTAMASYDPAWR